MLKWYIQPEKKFNGQTYRERKIVLDEAMIDVILKVPEAIVVSSWRSLAEQKAMVAKGASKTLQSNHRRGFAVDIVNWKEIDKKLEAVGLVNDISWDQNHYTLGGESFVAKKYPLINVDNSTEYKTKTNMQKDFINAIEKITGLKLGENINEIEQKDTAKLLEEFYDETTKEEEETKRLLEENKQLKASNEFNIKTAQELGLRLADTQLELENSKMMYEMKAADTKIMDAIMFVVKAIKSRL